MKPIRMQLTHKFKEAFKKLGYLEKFAEVNLSDRQDLAHFQCNGALAVSKSLKLNPRECAENIIKNLQLGESLEKGIELSIAGPGFINIKLSMQTLAEQVDPLLNQKKLGVDVTEENKKIIVDYGGPNVAKAMHVGHLRSLIIGDSLKKIHQYLNQEVVGDNHIGDWGTPMGMILADIQGNTDSITMDDLERIYPEAAAKFKTDEAFKTSTRCSTVAKSLV
jgi:arginyl-tRNA synthetase